MFSTDRLQKLLNLESQDSDLSYTINYKSHGPGYLDRWLLMEKNKHPWQQIDPTQAAPNRKKIIISEPIIKDSIPTSVELSFFASLIQNYNVYLWPGPNIALSKQKPLTTSSEFWEKRHQIKPATADTVQKSLGLESVKTDDYIILDHADYNKLLSKLPEMFTPEMIKEGIDTTPFKNKSSDILNLTEANFENLESILKAVDPEQLEKIILNAPNAEEIKQLLHLLPHPNMIHITGATHFWIETNLPLLQDQNVTLRFEKQEDPVTIPAKTNLKSLCIMNCNKIIDFASGAKVKKLHLWPTGFYEGKFCDLGTLDTLEDLTIYRIYPNSTVSSHYPR